MPEPSADPLFGQAHRNYVEASRCFARFGGAAGEICEDDGLTLNASGSTFPALLNSAWRTNASVHGDQVVRRADEWFGARGRGYSLSVRDGFGEDEDEDLRAAAESGGLVPLLSSPEMVCRERLDDKRPPDGVDLRWVNGSSTLAGFVAVSDAAYQSLGLTAGAVPEAIRDLAEFTAANVHSVVAYEDDVPLAAAQTILSDSIAGVYWVGVVEEARGRGLAEAVTRAVTNRAFDEGATANTLQASSMGESLYARMGYETIYRYTGFVRLEPVTT